MVLTKEQIDIIEDKTENSDNNMYSTILASRNLANVCTEREQRLCGPLM